MINYEDYMTETKGLKRISITNEQFWWSEDYKIGNDIVRFSCVKKLNRDTLAMENSEWVHRNVMS